MKAKVRNVVVFALSAVVAAAATYYFLRPNEEAKIKAAFARVSETISKSENESIVVAATKAKDIKDLLAGEVEIWAPEQNVDATVASSEIANQVTAVRAMCTSLSVSFQNVRVESIDGDTAHATASVLMSGTGVEAFLSGRDTRAIEAKLRKSPDDGKWRFSSVSVE